MYGLIFKVFCYSIAFMLLDVLYYSIVGSYAAPEEGQTYYYIATAVFGVGGQWYNDKQAKKKGEG